MTATEHHGPVWIVWFHAKDLTVEWTYFSTSTTEKGATLTAAQVAGKWFETRVVEARPPVPETNPCP